MCMTLIWFMWSKLLQLKVHYSRSTNCKVSLSSRWNMALRAQRVSIGLVRTGLFNILFFSESPHRAWLRGWWRASGKGSACLHRDGALSEIGLPNQNVEKYGLALLALLLSLLDDITQPVLVFAAYQVALTAVTVSHCVIICREKDKVSSATTLPQTERFLRVA